jgi:hypothetical protein
MWKEKLGIRGEECDHWHIKEGDISTEINLGETCEGNK